MDSSNRQPQRVWLPADTSLWRTCHILHDLSNGEQPKYQVETLFPLNNGDIALAAGKLNVDSLYAKGDGSYQTSSNFAFGTGLLGVALVAGSVVGNAARNSAARQRAAADAQVTWRPLFSGSVYVTLTGFMIQSTEGLFWWGWESLDLMQVADFNRVVIQGRSDAGSITWALNSEWSELIFVLWALNRYPRHPQLIDGSWLPANWVEWATAQGYRPHSWSTAIES